MNFPFLKLIQIASNVVMKKFHQRSEVAKKKKKKKKKKREKKEKKREEGPFADSTVKESLSFSDLRT